MSKLGIQICINCTQLNRHRYDKQYKIIFLNQNN